MRDKAGAGNVRDEGGTTDMAHRASLPWQENLQLWQSKSLAPASPVAAVSNTTTTQYRRLLCSERYGCTGS